MFAQHYTKCSDEALSGVRVGCKVLQHGHIVQSRGRDRAVRKQLEKELRRRTETNVTVNLFYLLHQRQLIWVHSKHRMFRFDLFEA